MSLLYEFIEKGCFHSYLPENNHTNINNYKYILNQTCYLIILSQYERTQIRSKKKKTQKNPKKCHPYCCPLTFKQEMLITVTGLRPPDTLGGQVGG